MESAIAIESDGFANMTSSGSACAGDDWNGEDGGGGGLWGVNGCEDRGDDGKRGTGGLGRFCLE